MRGTTANRIALGCGLAVFWFLVFITPRHSDDQAALPDPLVVGAASSLGALTIFPILSNAPQGPDRFLTLDAGLRAGSVEIEEIGAAAIPNAAANSAPAEDPFETPRLIVDEGRGATRAVVQSPDRQSVVRAELRAGVDDPFGSEDVDQAPAPSPQQAALFHSAAEPAGDVNRLLVTNRSTQPLYLMPGELFSGGRQDRALAHEVIVPPGAVRMPIDVFCVEHGRWQGRAPAESASVAMALLPSMSPTAWDEASIPAGGQPVEQRFAQMASQAQPGRFPISGAAVGKNVRLSISAGQDQGAVWEKVAASNQASGAASDSGAFTANYTQADIVAKLQPYQRRFARLADEPRVVGVIVAIDGRPDSADWFESTALFRKLWPKLLKSYALDAVAADAATAQAGAASAKGNRFCSPADAREFLTKALATPKIDGSVASAGLSTLLGDSDEVLTCAAHDRRLADAAAPGVGSSAPAAAVHSSAFAKTSPADHLVRPLDRERQSGQSYGSAIGGQGYGVF